LAASVALLISVVPQKLSHSLLFVQLAEERNALLALSLVQMLRESIDIGVAELFTGFKIRRAFEDGKNFVRQFVAWISR
jgi:hypothetical protein